jgi:transposase-like protein
MTPAIDGTPRALSCHMVDDARNEVSTRPAPTSRTCPQCLNPHTVVAEERYRGLMRFCPMCDYSWVIGQVDDAGKSKREDPGR